MLRVWGLFLFMNPGLETGRWGMMWSKAQKGEKSSIPVGFKEQRCCDSLKEKKKKNIHLSKRLWLKTLIIFFNIRDKSRRTIPLAFNQQLFKNSYLMNWRSFQKLLLRQDILKWHFSCWYEQRGQIKKYLGPFNYPRLENQMSLTLLHCLCHLMHSVNCFCWVLTNKFSKIYYYCCYWNRPFF